mmetsp:Transcript_3979/g.15843  ORF Transcript_3979/g.15843 Transcript_3979/m.15843 type:complete len:260 (+) Transcript_3979:679-1458(+)
MRERHSEDEGVRFEELGEDEARDDEAADERAERDEEEGGFLRVEVHAEQARDEGHDSGDHREEREDRVGRDEAVPRDVELHREEVFGVVDLESQQLERGLRRRRVLQVVLQQQLDVLVVVEERRRQRRRVEQMWRGADLGEPHHAHVLVLVEHGIQRLGRVARARLLVRDFVLDAPQPLEMFERHARRPQQLGRLLDERRQPVEVRREPPRRDSEDRLERAQLERLALTFVRGAVPPRLRGRRHHHHHHVGAPFRVAGG